MTAESEPLRRDLSRLAIAVLVINGLIGAGIFGLPSKVFHLTGAFSPAMFVICGLMMGTVMISFAMAASHFQGTGGPILYAQTAFGSFTGFETGWILYVGRATSVAANANLMASYIVPGTGGDVFRVLIILAVVAIFTALNYVGVRRGMASIMAITLFKLAPLALLILFGLAWIRPEAYAAAQLPVYSNFGEAMLLLVYAYIGFEGALIPAGETRDPRRDMPRALLLSGLVTTILYVLIQTVVVAVLENPAATDRPLAEVGGVLFGSAGVLMISAGAVVSVLGNTGASMLSAPRMTYSLARGNCLPQWFGRVHDRYRTPHVSILFYGVLSAALALPGSFESLAKMSSLARILGYLVCVLAALALRRRLGASEHELKIPGASAFPVLAVFVCVWLIAQASSSTALLTLGFLAAGAILYTIARRGAAGDAAPATREEPPEAR